MKALVLNQAYMLLKLRNNYYIVLICAFGSIPGNILQKKTNQIITNNYNFFGP